MRGIGGRGRPPVAIGGELPNDLPREGINIFLKEAEGPANERDDTDSNTDETSISPATQDQVAGLFKKLKPLEEAKGDEVDFALREKSLPAPKTGTTILKPFPLSSEEEPPTLPSITSKSGSLEVVRYLPEGELSEVAPRVSITFSHAMIAIGTVEDVANQNIPVKLTPQPEGRWRWLGTKTIVFEPSKHRLPSSTLFTVEIPAETKGINGESLEKTTSFTFSTPKIKVTQGYPRDVTKGRRAPMFLSFDQVINPQALLDSSAIQVSAGGTELSLTLLTQEEVDAVEDIKNLARYAQHDRDSSEGRTWMAFRATEELPYDSDIQITVGPNIPSAEGPLLDPTYSYSYSFHTYGPFKFRNAPNFNVVPNSDLKIQLTNDIEEESLVESDFQIVPAIASLQIRVESSWLVFSGTTVRGSYLITLPTSLRDVYGQNLLPGPAVTISVGPAQPNIHFQRQGHLIMDPALEPQYPFSTINVPKVRVVIRRVSAKDFLASPFELQIPWAQNKDLTYWMGKAGETVLDTIMELNSPPDEYLTTVLNLREYLQHPKEGTGHLLLGIQPTEWNNEEAPRSVSWLQFTRLGLEVYGGNSCFIIWTNSLLDGSPVAGTKVWGSGLEKPVVTGSDGTVTVNTSSRSFIFASKDNDWTVTPYHCHPIIPQNHSHPIFHVFDDRKLYKPKEAVHVKGYIRTSTVANNERTLSIPPTSQLSWKVTDARGAQLAEGKTPTSKYGSFDFNFSIPDTANLGPASIFISGDAGTAYHNFDIQEFRRPEFKSSVQSGSGPHLPNGSTVITASAQYYSGGNLSDASVHWEVTSKLASFSPPGWEGFSFGTRRNVGVYRFSPDSELQRKVFDSKTDITGSHYLEVSWKGMEKVPSPITINAEARILDLNNQAISSSTSFLLHPSTLYVGLKPSRCFVSRKHPLELELIVTSLDGTAVRGISVNVITVRHREVYKRKSWRTEMTRTVTATLTSESQPLRHELRFEEEGGSYDLEVSIVDDQGNANCSSIPIWVSGGPNVSRSVNIHHELKIIADKEKYQPGEVAKLLVVSPFEKAEGIYMMGSIGLEKSERFSVTTEGYTIEIPILVKHIPNVSIMVDICGASMHGEGEDQHLIPARASTIHQLSVSNDYYKLQVDVQPQESVVQPGGETTIHLQVRADNGTPSVEAEVVVIAVDDAVLALTGYTLPSALEVFHQPGYYHSGGSHNRDLLWIVDRKDLQPHIPAVTEDFNLECCSFGFEGAPGGGKRKMLARGAPRMMMARGEVQMSLCSNTIEMDLCGGGAGGPEPTIAVRSNFDPLALFVASVVSDKEGKATVNVKLPDNLTSYRIWAFACWSTNHFGQAESSILAQLPLAIRPSIPRFLNFGDKAVLSVVVSNQHQAAQQAVVAVRGTNVTIDEARSGYVVRLGAKKRAVLSIPVESKSAGTARFQFALSSAHFSDATELSIPVWTPATTEAFATYGEILDGTSGHVVQPLVAPSEAKVFPQFGGVEITTSSTALSSLTDAYLYLSEYPYECVEQITSRALTTVALEKVLRAFGKAIPSEQEIIEQQTNDLNKLKDRQHQATGGFGWWTGHSETSPFLTVHVAHLVQRLLSKSIALPSGLNVNGLKSYLRSIDSHFPPYFTIEYRNSIKAYALYVLKRFNELSKEEAVVLYQTAKETLSLEGLAWLLVAIDDPTAPESQEILHQINKSVEETAETAHFVTDYNDTGKYVFLASNRRTDGILLEALLDTQFANGNVLSASTSVQTLIPKLAKGLLANRKKGRWGNTQENCFILLALNRYFEIYEAGTPNYSARFWLDEHFAGEHTYKGRSIDNHLTRIPMSSVVVPTSSSSSTDVSSTTRQLTLSKEGAEGILYYRFGVSYAPRDLNLKHLDQGFEVTRTYEAVDDPSHVRYDSETKTWHFKSGERVRVRLSLTNVSRRYHVALVDKLPAGLEAINPSLKTSESMPRDPNQSHRGCCFFFQSWFEHQNFRDERVEAFASLLLSGQHNYSYVARATAKGTYVVPPAHAEEMYSPEVFGRSNSEIVIIS